MNVRPMGMEDFCRLKAISAPTFSPAGKTACFVVSQPRMEKNDYSSCIYLYQNGQVRQLTAGGKESSFCYLDEDTLLFPAQREEEKEPGLSSHFYAISLLGGEATLAYTFPIPVEKVIPLPGGDLLVVGKSFPGYEELYTGDAKLAKAYLEHKKENEDYEEVATLPWWWNGGTYTRGAYSRLFRYDRKKKKLLPLTEAGQSVSDVQLHPQRQEVYYSLLDVTVPMPEHFRGETLYRTDLKTGEQTLILAGEEGFRVDGYALGKSRMVLLADDNKYGMNTDGDFFTLDYDTLAVQPYALHGEAIGSSVGSDVRHGGGQTMKMVGDTLYFISTRFDTAELYRLEEGTIEPVTGRGGSVDCFDVCESTGELLCCALWDMKGQELYNGAGKQVTHLNDKALSGLYVARPEEIRFEREGHELHGFVLKPRGFQPGGRYPVILDVHGGPKTVYGPVFYHEMQYWAGQGYFVVYCNPTGSDGRGGFMDIRGKYGTVDYEDIMAFCDRVLDQYPEMDRENFFETGGSYGGFMTNWIIGHTDRFRACVSQRSISNWISFYGVSDIGPGFGEDQCGGSIWPDCEKMWWHSPLRYADRVKTPTLFIHSMEDYRCPIDQGYQMYSALLTHGVETKMVLFRGENHELSRSGKPKHRVKRLGEITNWFEIHKTTRK